MSARRLFAALSVALGSFAFMVSAAPVARAVGTDDPNIAFTAAGVSVSAATDGSAFTSTASAPITLNGQTSQVITKTWNKDHLRYVAGSVTAPEGWTIEYTTDGTTWSSSAPADLTTVTGVRTTGALTSIGYSNGLQTSITNAPSTIKQATVGGLPPTGAGDGYDVFFDEQYTKLFNVFHHSNPAQIDCHSLYDGSRCSGYPMNMPHSLGTNDRSTGVGVGSKVWVPLGYGNNPGGGFACFKTAGGACTTPFVQLTTNVNTGVHSNVGNVTRVGQYLFTQNFKDGLVLCLDTNTEAACANMPSGGFDLGTGYTQSYPSTVMSVGTRVYSSNGRGKVGCLDTATWALCTGWSTPWNTTKYITIFALPNAAGEIVAVCSFDTNSAECVDETKTTYTVPASLATARAAIPESGLAGVLAGYESMPRTSGSRLYWVNMVWNSSQSGGKIACWDAALNSGAGGQCTFTSNGLSYISDEAYALTVDPQNANCLWTNDDNGNIESFDATTGSATCPVPSDAVVQIPYSVAVPRFACSEPGRIRQWDSITVAGTGVTLSDMRVTMKKNGVAVTGGVSMAADPNGRVSLSHLNVATTGTQPTFEITAAGLNNTQAATITGDVKYLSDPPQLCLNLTPLAYCPTNVGPAGGTTVARPADTVSLTVRNAAGAATNNYVASESVTRSSITNCVGTLNGNVSVNTGSGTIPVQSGTVSLRDTNGNVVATTTTDTNGDYSFPDYYPHGYTVHFASSQQGAVVTANAVTTKNFVLSVNPPASNNVTNTTAQNVPVTTDISATSDPTTSIDASTLQVRSGSGAWGSSVTVAGEGTWTVTAGKLRFTPLPTFSGVATPVDYRVADGYGITTASTASVTVTASTITAAPDAKTGAVDQPMTLAAAANSGNVPIMEGSVELKDDATGAFAARMSVPGVGTFAASTTTNTVTFTPATGWTGVRKVSYRVRDVSGKVAESTMTVTISPERTPRVVLRNGRNGATITWSDSPTPSVVSYVVKLNGRTICTVADANRVCTYPKFVGRAAAITVTSVGGDETVSPEKTAVKLSECRVVGSIQFGTDLAVVTKRADEILKRIGDASKRQRVSGICFIGHTDARDTFMHNNNLSYWRANNAYAHMRPWISGKIDITLDYAGEHRPRATNSTPRGMYLNRRVDIGIRP